LRGASIVRSSADAYADDLASRVEQRAWAYQFRWSAVRPSSHGARGSCEEALRALKQFGTPILDGVGPMPYCQLNSMLDANYPKGALNYWKSNFLAELSDDAIASMLECFAECPTKMGQLLLEHIHGAATRIRPEETAFPHRAAG